MRPAPPDRRPVDRLARVALAAGVVAAVASTAWIADDALVPLRVAHQLAAGHGLVWNADERVQVFTSPLWTLLVAALAPWTWRGEALLAGLGIACTAAWTAPLILRRPRLGTAALVAVAVVASPTLLEFATSGLENALTHLLIVATVAALASGRERAAALLAGLLLVDRLDQALIVAPLAAAAVARGGWASARRWLLALPAPAAWVVFATAYYGSPVPNTALAKLDTGLPWADRLAEGGRYVVASVTWDPVLAWLLLGGVALGARAARRDPLSGALAAALALSVGWTAWIGGDFMAGRFLAAPAVLGLLAIVRAVDRVGPAIAWEHVVGVVVLGALAPHHPLGPRGDETVADEGDVVDERAFWMRGAHPLHDPGTPPPVVSGCPTPPVRVVSTVGRQPTWAPLDVHVVDDMALADPLLVRLPLISSASGWRAGHVRRQLPAGYLETLASGRNALVDPGIAACWERVRLATRAPLAASGRAGAIVRLATVGCADLVAPHVGCDTTDPRFVPWCGDIPDTVRLEPRDAVLAACRR